MTYKHPITTEFLVLCNIQLTDLMISFILRYEQYNSKNILDLLEKFLL